MADIAVGRAFGGSLTVAEREKGWQTLGQMKALDLAGWLTPARELEILRPQKSGGAATATNPKFRD